MPYRVHIENFLSQTLPPRHATDQGPKDAAGDSYRGSKCCSLGGSKLPPATAREAQRVLDKLRKETHIEDAGKVADALQGLLLRHA